MVTVPKPLLARSCYGERPVESESRSDGDVRIVEETKTVTQIRRHFLDVTGMTKERVTAIRYWIKGGTRD